MSSANTALLALAADRALIALRGREIRKAARLGLVEAAAAVPVHEATLCRWELSRRIPRADLARAYARFLRELDGLTG